MEGKIDGGNISRHHQCVSVFVPRHHVAAACTNTRTLDDAFRLEEGVKIMTSKLTIGVTLNGTNLRGEGSFIYIDKMNKKNEIVWISQTKENTNRNESSCQLYWHKNESLPWS